MRQAKYEPYPNYRDSQLAWLREMPQHWDLLKAKWVFNRVQRPVRPEDGVVTAFRDGQVTLRSNRRVDGFTNALKEIGYQGVREGDLLVHAMDGFAGAIGISESDGKCSPVCSVCVPQNHEQLDVSYYGYLVRQLAVTDFITSLAKGIRERSTEFRFSEFAVLPLAVPPKEEQTRIAKFLDHETAKIDALIEKQQQLIALLKEKRQAVISHAVTKGLNPDAPMRDSGVEWLGEIPAHWTVAPLKRFIVLQRGHDLPSEARREGNYPVVSSAGPIDSHDEYRCKGPGIVTGRYGTIGEFYYARGNFWPLNTALYSIHCHGNNERFLLYMLRNMKHLFVLNSLKAAVPGVDRNDVHGEYTVAPPQPQEQCVIAVYLDDQMARLDELTAKAEEGIELLCEHRTALISAAVTGKIDVRGWNPPKSKPLTEAA